MSSSILIHWKFLCTLQSTPKINHKSISLDIPLWPVALFFLQKFLFFANETGRDRFGNWKKNESNRSSEQLSVNFFFYYSSTKIKLEKRTKSKLCAALHAVCLPRGPGFLQGNRLTMWVGHLGAYLPEVLGSFVKVLFPAAAAFGSNKGPATKNLIFAHLLGSPGTHTLVHIFTLFCG